MKNRLGLTKEQMLELYQDRLPKKVQKEVNKHIHYVNNGVCKICNKMLNNYEINETKLILSFYKTK